MCEIVQIYSQSGIKPLKLLKTLALQQGQQRMLIKFHNTLISAANDSLCSCIMRPVKDFSIKVK